MSESEPCLIIKWILTTLCNVNEFRLLSEATPTVSQNNEQSHTQSQPSAQEQSTGDTGPDIVVEAAKMKE